MHITEHTRDLLAAPVQNLDWEAAARKWTEAFAKPRCEKPLRPVQGAALEALYRSLLEYATNPALDADGEPWGPRGILGPVGVGHGKTYITFLLPLVVKMVRGSCRPMLIVPPDLVQKTRIDFAQAARHYKIRMPKVVSMGVLSHRNHSGIFERVKPDLIMVDEAHYLASRKSARTKRLLRWVVAHPETVCVFLSGTITHKSIKDYSHLSLLALRDYSPIPGDEDELELWQSILDVKGEPVASAHAALLPLVNWHLRRTGKTELESGKAVTKDLARDAFRERLRSLPGVIATDDTGCQASLDIRQWHVTLPDSWQAAAGEFDEEAGTWETPDGEEVTDALAATRARTQLSSGYYSRWIWPLRPCPGVWTTFQQTPCRGPGCPTCGGSKMYDGPDAEWMERRRAWSATERSILENFEQKTGQDSPALVRDLARQGKFGKYNQETLEAWEAIQNRYYTPGLGNQPPMEYVDLDPGPEWLAGIAREWVKSVKRGLIWYNTPHVGDALAKAGFRVFGAGTSQPPDRLAAPCLKIDVHGTGKNFQAWDRNLVLEFSGNARRWEQMIGRTHRAGQESDEVRIDVLNDGGVRARAFFAARVGAEYIQRTTGMTQRLRMATILDPIHGKYVP